MEDISIGRELLDETLFFSVLSCLFTFVWYLFCPQKSTATGAQVPKESLSLFTSFMSLLHLFLYFCLTFSLSLQFSQVLLLQSVSKQFSRGTQLCILIYVYSDNMRPVGQSSLQWQMEVSDFS